MDTISYIGGLIFGLALIVVLSIGIFASIKVFMGRDNESD